MDATEQKLLADLQAAVSREIDAVIENDTFEFL
jgi:hypothetical protein